MKKLALMAASCAAIGTAEAVPVQYNISVTSTLSDVRKIGGQNIPEISLYSSCIAPSIVVAR